MTLDAAIAAALAGDVPPPIAAMRIVLATEEPEAALRRVAAVPELAHLHALLEASLASWQRLRTVARAAEGAADWPSAFDHAAAVDPDLAAALYTLGDPNIRRGATAEVVTAIHIWANPTRTSTLLDFGCGHGRIAEALAPEAGLVVGLDASRGMLAAGAWTTARPVLAQDAGALPFRTGAFDAVVAVDSMPYVLARGTAAGRASLAEFARVLRKGGRALVFNLAYGIDMDDECRLATDLAAQSGFDLVEGGPAGFRHWDARVYIFQVRQT